MTSYIPEPITFNPVKHHYRFLLKQINKWRFQEWQEVEEELRTIGNNLLDLYLGNLSINTICNEMLLFFEAHKLSDRETFLKWIDHAGYKKIQLSDESQWVIKKGDNFSRYLHIHPGKNSLHTIRIRATTLKTVIAVKIQLPEENGLPPLQEVNRIRAEFLNLSPVKKLQQEKGILKLWQIFNL
ncbi:MAG: hypothetical protein ACOC11_02745 [Prolixibacteraceae bacterium]